MEPRGTFARRLARLMEERGLTQAELGRRMHEEDPYVGNQTREINNWLKARSEPTYQSLRLLRSALGCTWEELMEG